jgi:hypothetical protein
MKRSYLCLILLLLAAGSAWAQGANVSAGWDGFVIRNGNTTASPPNLVDRLDLGAGIIEIQTWEGGQKAALGTDLLNGVTVAQVGALHIDRLDNVSTSGSLYGPYFNIWVTDGAGQFAVIANEPSDAEWAADRWYSSGWAFLSTKRCKVYEVTGASGGEPGTSWVATWTGKSSGLVFADVAGLTVLPPSAAYITNPANGVGSGAPREIGTNVAYGYNWIFGDTAANYVTGGNGFIVGNYYAMLSNPVTNVTQGISYATIEAALAAAADNNLITIGAGSYNPPSTLDVARPLTLTGAGAALVTINIPAAGGYGFHVAAHDVTLSGFTLSTNNANLNYPIHASGTTNAPGGFTNLTISDIVISGVHRRAGLDIHGYNNVTVTDVTSSDAYGGNGVQLTGVVGATLSNITTLNNTWGSISIYCSQYMPRASSNITIDGNSCSLAEKNVFVQDGYGLASTNVSVTGYEYMVRNPVHRAGGELYFFYQDTLADAVALAIALDGAAVGSYVRPLAGGPFVVQNGMRIQPAIGAAAAGDAITVGAGTYEEQLHITKNNLVITGAGVGSTVVRSPASLPLFYLTGTTQNKPIVFVDGCTGLQMSALTVDGAGRGNLNNRFQGVGFWNAGGTLSDAAVINVMDTPFSGAQHGVGIYAYNITGGPYTVTLSDVVVSSFQKNGLALSGAGLTVDLDDLDVTGAGPTGVTAQNGIQVGFGAGGTMTDCTVSGIHYTGPSWTASGVLLYSGTTISAVNVDVANSQTSIYCLDTNVTFSGTDVTAATDDGLFAYNTAAKSGDFPRRVAQPFDDYLPTGGLKSAMSVNVMNSRFAGTGVANSWGVGGYALAPLNFTVTGCEVTGFDYGIRVYQGTGGSVNGAVSGCNIHDNLSYGLYTNATSTVAATCNWWGHIDGPDAVGNPSDGDAISAGATYAPWLDAVGGACVMYGDNNVSVADAPVCVTSAATCVSLPVTFNRLDTTDSRGVSVTFQLSPELVLCTDTPITDITVATGAGSWSEPNTNLWAEILDNGGGSYTVDRTIIGTPCGSDHGGTLFHVNVKPSPAVTTEAIGTVTVTAVTVRDCDNAPLPGIPGAAGEVAINLTTPAALAGLVAAQVKLGNDSDGTTEIALSWTAPTGDVDFISIWRKGYGDYPEYNDGTGAVPAAPVTAGNGWTLVNTIPATSTGYTDEPPVRDFWYYAAYVADECGNTSPVSAITSGTLNYHLGDVTNGVVNGTGDNLVSTGDISLLGTHYGATLTTYGDARNYLDVGPTTDYSVNARPTTDNRLQFEDLMMFAINYGDVSKIEPHTAPADANAIALVGTTVGAVGSTFDVAVVLSANGKLQGLSVPLAWDAAVIEPVGMSPGDLLAAYGGQALVLSPEPGTVDAALMGVRDKAIAGQGVLATVTFRVKAAGNAAVTLGNVSARDKDNRPLVISGARNDLPAVGLPSVSELKANVPNPFNPSTEFSFVLAQDGAVSLRVYSVRGELVRTLVEHELQAGPHSLTWNGLDDQGRQVASGAYIVRFIAPDRTQSRHVTLLK